LSYNQCAISKRKQILPRTKGGNYSAFAYWKITHLKIEIEKNIAIMKYVLLRNVAHMPKEERLRTRYNQVTA
jgi:hypothetical protein